MYIYVWYTYGEVRQQNIKYNTHTHTLTLPVLGVYQANGIDVEEWRVIRWWFFVVLCDSCVCFHHGFVCVMVCWCFFSFLSWGWGWTIPDPLLLDYYYCWTGSDRIGRSDLTLFIVKIVSCFNWKFRPFLHHVLPAPHQRVNSVNWIVRPDRRGDAHNPIILSSSPRPPRLFFVDSDEFVVMLWW